MNNYLIVAPLMPDASQASSSSQSSLHSHNTRELITIVRALIRSDHSALFALSTLVARDAHLITLRRKDHTRADDRPDIRDL